jgi:hypothetical protein
MPLDSGRRRGLAQPPAPRFPGVAIAWWPRPGHLVHGWYLTTAGISPRRVRTTRTALVAVFGECSPKGEGADAGR